MVMAKKGGMMMKKILYYTGIILMFLYILVQFSCLPPMEQVKTGIELVVPTRQIYTIPGEEYYAQVYLLIDRELFRLGTNTDYVEQGLDEAADQESIIVENIPAGRYVLWLGIGIKTANGAFNVQKYYESQEFELVAGSTVRLYALLLDCPFDKALNILGENINGVVVNNIGGAEDDLYASGPKNLYYFDTQTFGEAAYHTPDPDFDVTELYDETDITLYTINSLSEGLNYTGGVPQNYLFLSTTRGISKWNGSGVFDDNYSYQGGNSYGLGRVNVLKTLALADGNNVCAFFQRSGGLGGVYEDSGFPTLAEWVNVDFSRLLKGELVWDFCVTDDLTYNCGYFATPLGALRIPKALIENYTSSVGFYFLRRRNQFFGIQDSNNNKLPILSLGYDSDGSRTLYMGTQEGLYSGIIPANGIDFPPVASITIVNGTENTRIFRILLNDTYRAYISNTYLFFQQKSTGNIVPIPYVAGIPGEISAIDWHGNTLVMSGTLGVVTLDVNTLSF